MTTAHPTPEPTADTERDRFVERLLNSAGGAMDLFAAYIGDRLGFYCVLAEDGPVRAGELAARTGTHERYVREWLEQQTITGVLRVDDPSAAPEARRFHLPAGHAEALTDIASLDYIAPLAQVFVGAVSPIEQVVNAYRTGDGVSYEAYGRDMREGQARMNRALFLQALGREWLPSIPDVHDRLSSTPPARIADVGCGAGWSSIGMARAYPQVRVDGFDLDAPSIELARRNLVGERRDVVERVSFECRDAADVPGGSYDLVIALECVHDMTHPVEVLRTMRRLAGDGGTVLVVDERVGETFTETGNDVEWMMYGWSILHCLPVGLDGHACAGTGTVMRPDTLRGYARDAGFADVEILPIENFFFRVYRLVQEGGRDA